MQVGSTWNPEETPKPRKPEALLVSDEDRTMAMLAWMPFIGGLVSLYILLAESERVHPFRKFHAVNSLMFNIVMGVVVLVLSVALVGLCLLPLALGYQAYMAYQAYQGQWREVPMLTDFARGQQWI